MDFKTLLHLLTIFVRKYFREEMDPSLKPPNSAACIPCRSIKFDFIIVGAGSEGCVLANRLSANPHRKVLLIEAGDDEDYITDVPALSYRLVRTKYDWNFTTVPQTVCAGQQGRCDFPMGHVMGGTSTINGMLYMRGNRYDYDQWEAMGNPGWGYQDALFYFKKAENMTIPEYANDTVYHSTEGPLPISYALFNTSLMEDYVQQYESFGLKKIDYNGAEQIGAAFNQLTLKGPTRCSTSKAYLDPIRHRKNLYIFKNTLAIKILFDKTKRAAIGVRCRTKGEEYNVYAGKEVILTAGAINTPKLLMLSGVGPKEHLEELCIPVLADLPVGQNFIDLPSIRMAYYINNDDLEYIVNHLADYIKEYARDKSGALTAPGGLRAAFLNSSNPTASDTLPDVIFIGENLIPSFSTAVINYPGVALFANVLDPKSRGAIKLKSSNYEDAPLIDPNYYQVKSDYEILLRSMLLVQVGFTLEPFSSFCPHLVVPPNCDYSGVIDDEFSDCFIKQQNSYGYNAMSTCKMGPASDRTTVVDSTLKVHTIKNLRVADASIIPKPPRAIISATQVMIAEKAADLILKDHCC